EPVHFLQIWIVPDQKGLKPGYEQKTFADAEKRGTLRLVASRDGRDGSVTIHRDVALYATLIGNGERVPHHVKAGRAAWVQVARGTITLNGQALKAGDGVAIGSSGALELTGTDDAEVLLFDLPATNLN